MKITRKPSISNLVLGAASVTSIALTLHFNSVAEDFKQSHIELNAKYTDVLVENEELRDTTIQLSDKVAVLTDEAEKSSGLLEQSRLEIERLNKETDTLQAEVKKKDGQIDAFRNKVAELEKKTKQPQVISRGESEAGEWKNFRLTYYDNNYQSTGKRPGDKGYGITASGRQTTAGVSIAVDPNVIPLGTWVLIKWPDGKIEKRRADDTGSAIKGYDIDYYVPKASLSMGDSMVAVKILGKE